MSEEDQLDLCLNLISDASETLTLLGVCFDPEVTRGRQVTNDEVELGLYRRKRCMQALKNYMNLLPEHSDRTQER